MHATDLVDSGTLVAMIVGLVIFMVVYWAIFRKKK